MQDFSNRVTFLTKCFVNNYFDYCFYSLCFSMSPPDFLRESSLLLHSYTEKIQLVPIYLESYTINLHDGSNKKQRFSMPLVFSPNAKV